MTAYRAVFTTAASRVKQATVPGLLLKAMALVAIALVAGCLSRQTGPSLPYVKPAQSVAPVDPAQVHLAARMQDMETEMQRLRDTIERLQVSGGQEKELRSLQERVAFIEKQLGIEAPTPVGGPSHQPGSPQPEGGPVGENLSRAKPTAGPGVPGKSPSLELVSKPLSPEEKAYREAYAAYKSGALDQSINLFEDFLSKFPKSEFSSNAVYWIGEARFSQGRFDEAVLQFDRIIKEFPGSKKELNSLLRQGQAFEKMGDSRSARIIYQKILSDYPHTAQARIAATRIKALPTQ